MPIPRSGNLLWLGSLSLSKRLGYYWAKTGHNKSFTVSGDTVDCATNSQDRDEEYTYRVYCKGPCDLGVAWDAKEAIDVVLDRAIDSGGRTVLLWRENGAVMRRELIGGVAREVEFQLQRTVRQTVPLDVSVTVRNSLILDPLVPGSISGDWCDPDSTYWALLVDTSSSMLTQGQPNALTDYTLLSEFDGGGYARVKVTNRVCNGSVSWTSDDISFPLLGVGTNPIGGLIIYSNILGVDRVIGAFPHSFFGGPVTPVGTTLTFRVNAEGLFNASHFVWQV